MAPAPAQLARWLAKKFFFSETREHFNRLLGMLHLRTKAAIQIKTP
jgi:hypothetical protein